MVLKLAAGVQVRKESWGLLFYSQDQHRLLFVRSGNWLLPHHLDGRWTVDGIAADISHSLSRPPGAVASVLQKTVNSLVTGGMVYLGLR